MISEFSFSMSCERSDSFGRTCLGTANQARHSDAFFSASLGQSHRCASTLLRQAFQRPLNKEANNPRKILRVISRPAVRATLFARVPKTRGHDDDLPRAGAFRLLVGAWYIRLSS